MKEKKSFFERLTGAVNEEEDTDFDTSPASKSMTKIPVKNGEGWIEEDGNVGELTVDVYQTGNDVIIKTMVAGVRKDDLDISLSRDMVTIKGKREEDRTISDDDYFHRELYWGSFERTIVLPHEVDVESAEAYENNGLLTIKLPKIDKNRQTKLKVKTA